MRVVLAVVVGLVAFVWGLLAVSHKCSAGSQLIESSTPFVVAVLSAGTLFIVRRYAVAFLLLVVLFALVLLGGSYYKEVIHRGAPEEMESLPAPNQSAAANRRPALRLTMTDNLNIFTACHAHGPAVAELGRLDVSRPRMTIPQRLSLMWRRFSPLEERLIAAVREVLPPQAQAIFDAQIAGVTLVQRLPPHWLEISFYRQRRGKVDWGGIPTFPRSGEFRLAEVQFSVGGRHYKATLTSIGGHAFDFTVRPSPKAIAFADWDAAPSARLLSDPMKMDSASEPQPIPDSWREFLARRKASDLGEWALHDSQTAFRTAFTEGEFLVLAEREGDQFVLHRIDPPASSLFYLDSHDGRPEPLKGELDDVFRDK